MAVNRTDRFQTLSVPRAVMGQILPAIASQMVALVYNLADTYFVGLLNDPVQTAAITVATPVFVLMTAIANLFGVGGASAVARALGRKDQTAARQISAVSFWWGLIAAGVFCVTFGLISRPVLTLIGADAATLTLAASYACWTVTIGGVGTILNGLLAHLIRAEGRSGAAGAGVMAGGILNLILDPFFILPQFLDMGATGAAIATALSSGLVTVGFLIYLLTLPKTSGLSLAPGLVCHTRRHIKGILLIGFPSALQFTLTVVSVSLQTRFIAQYGNEAVAAYGIVKKLDQLPLFFAIGVSNGLLPILAYYASAGDHDRRRRSFRLGSGVAVGFAVLCLIAFEIFAPQLTGLFMEDTLTVQYAAGFLRRMVTAMPLMAVCYPMIIQFQAMGLARESMVLSILRKGVLDIPLLFLLDGLWGMYGCAWVQPVVDTIALVVSLILYRRINERKR